MAIKNALNITISQESVDKVRDNIGKSKEIYENVTDSVKSTLVKSIAKETGLPESFFEKEIGKFVDESLGSEKNKVFLEQFDRAFNAASKTDLGRYVFDAEKVNNALGLFVPTNENKEAWTREISEKWAIAVKNLSSKEAREAIAAKINIGNYLDYMKGEQNLIVIIGNSVVQGTYNIISKTIDEDWAKFVDDKTRILHEKGLLTDAQVEKIKAKLHTDLAGFDVTTKKIDDFSQTIGNGIYGVVDYFGSGKADRAVNSALDKMLNATKDTYQSAKKSVLDALNIKERATIVQKIDNRSPIQPLTNICLPRVVSIQEKANNLVNR
jgi:hypothetical protein